MSTDPPPPSETAEFLPTWHGTVAYDGTNYAGWQIQPDAPTIQGELQKRLRLLFRDTQLRVNGTSRTDAGVHALDQHFSFVAAPAPELTPDRLGTTLNRWLPPQIRVRNIQLAHDGFHARHAACAKAYTYAIHEGRDCSPFHARWIWQYRAQLDVDRMRLAASALTGEHDFRNFATNSKTEVSTTVKTLHRLDVIRQPPYIFVNALGNAFLYRMVRALTGYLVLEAGGRADWSPDHVAGVLTSDARPACVQTAPPQGLFLAKVFFGPDEWQTYEPLLPPFAVP